jgi:hypothetical protein
MFITFLNDTGVIDTGDKHLFAYIFANFRKQFEMVIMGYSGARGKLIREIHFNYAVMLKSVICVPSTIS